MLNPPRDTPLHVDDKPVDDLFIYPGQKLYEDVKEAGVVPVITLSYGEILERSLRRNSEVLAVSNFLYFKRANHLAFLRGIVIPKEERKKLVESIANEDLGIDVNDFFDEQTFEELVKHRRTIEQDKYYLAQIPFISVANVFNILGALINPSTFFSFAIPTFKATSIAGKMAANLATLGARGALEGTAQAAILRLDQDSRWAETKEHILGNTMGYMLLGGAGQLLVKGAANISSWVRARNMRHSVDAANNFYKEGNQGLNNENSPDFVGPPKPHWEVNYMATEQFQNLVQAIKDNKGLDAEQIKTLLTVTDNKKQTIIAAFRRLLLSGDITTDMQKDIIESMAKELLSDADIDKTAVYFLKTTALDFFARDDTKNEASNLLSGWLRSPIMEMFLSKSKVFRSVAAKLFSTVFKLRKNERGVASLSAEDYIIQATNRCIHEQVQNRKRFVSWLEANNLHKGWKSWFMQGQYLKEYERAVNNYIRQIKEPVPYTAGEKIIAEQAEVWRARLEECVMDAVRADRISPEHGENFLKDVHTLARRYDIGAIIANRDEFINLIHDEWYLPNERKKFDRLEVKNIRGWKAYNDRLAQLEEDKSVKQQAIKKIEKSTGTKKKAQMNRLKELKEDIAKLEREAVDELAEMRKELLSKEEIDTMRRDIEPEAMRRAKRATEEIVADKMTSQYDYNVNAYVAFKSRSINIPDSKLAKFLDTNTEANVLHFYKTVQTHTALFKALEDYGGKIGFRKSLELEREAKIKADPANTRAYEEGYAKLLNKFEDYLSLLDNTLMKKQGASSEFMSDFFLTMKNLSGMAKLGFIFFSSLPDLSNLALRRSDLFRSVFEDKGFMSLFNSREVKALNKHEAQMAGIGYDAVSSELFMKVHDLSPQTTTEAIYSKTNKRRIGEFLMDIVHKASLMPYWQNWVRGYAYRIATAKVSYDLMHNVDLAHLGIDKNMAKRIKSQLEDYGYKTEEGNFVFANKIKWADKQARDVYEIALRKFTDSTIIVPTRGNTPIAFQRSAFGSLVGLFQKFQYSMLNMLVLPLLQGGKGELAAYMAMSIMVGGFSDELKALARGEEDAFDFSTNRENKIIRFIANGFGASGMLGKFFGIGASMLSRGLEEDTRLYEVARGAAGQLFGPGFDVPVSLIEGAFDLAMFEGEQAWKRLRHNIPMQNNFIIQSFYNNVFKED